MMKDFVKLYFVFFFVLVFVTIVQTVSDPEVAGFSEAVSNLYERRGIAVAIYLVAPFVLAAFMIAFQKLLSKFKSK